MSGVEIDIKLARRSREFLIMYTEFQDKLAELIKNSPVGKGISAEAVSDELLVFLEKLTHLYPGGGDDFITDRLAWDHYIHIHDKSQP